MIHHRLPQGHRRHPGQRRGAGGQRLLERRITVLDIEAEKGRRLRPVRPRIEGEDDRVADLEFGMADHAVLADDPAELLGLESSSHEVEQLRGVARDDPRAHRGVWLRDGRDALPAFALLCGHGLPPVVALGSSIRDLASILPAI
jgi:hypothetical protein